MEKGDDAEKAPSSGAVDGGAPSGAVDDGAPRETGVGTITDDSSADTSEPQFSSAVVATTDDASSGAAADADSAAGDGSFGQWLKPNLLSTHA